MLREVLIEQREARGEEGKSWRLGYYLLVDEVGSGGFFCESYGVRVALLESGETAQVRHITTSRSRIEELLERLCRNLVTPVTLHDVVEDMVQE